MLRCSFPECFSAISFLTLNSSNTLFRTKITLDQPINYSSTIHQPSTIHQLFSGFLINYIAEISAFTNTVIDLEFVHANSKCYLKTSIILITGEQSSKYPFALFLGLYPSWSFLCSRDREQQRNY